MIARITKILLLLQLVVVVVLSLAAARAWHWNAVAALAFGIGAVLLLRVAITANSFVLAARYRGPIPAAFRLDMRGRWRLFWREFNATMLSSSWSMPFRRFRERPAATPRGLPVLLVHGYGCNSGYWDAMSHALSQASITHHALDLEPVLGGIDEYVPALGQALQRLQAASGQRRCVIVAHSMGGLAMRAYLRACGTDHIAKIITLGTPHNGTALANFGIGANTHDMGWVGRGGQGQPSAWLRALDAAESPERNRLFVSIYSHHDNIISPPSSSALAGARNIELGGVGHVALALEPTVQELVVREILAAAQT